MSGRRFALGAALLLAAGSDYVFATGREFNSLVSELSRRYQIHATRMPLMGLVSLCARVASHGGVKDLHVAEFDNLGAAIDFSELHSLVRESLGREWQPFVTEQSRKGGEQSIIFVRATGSSMRMLIAEYEHNELDVVAMELNGEALAKWVSEPTKQRNEDWRTKKETPREQ